MDHNCVYIAACENINCQNGGTCRAEVHTAVCYCQQGYTGNRCQSLINYCDPSPCYNFGVCTHNTLGFTCQCEQKYDGDYCQTRFNPCNYVDPPCVNDGKCKTDYQKETHYECECVDELRHFPPHCDVHNHCTERDEPCLNGGVCVLQDRDPGYLCACKEGYGGTQCEKEIPEQPVFTVVNICMIEPCKNGGTCNPISGADYTCSCINNYSGFICHLYPEIRRYYVRVKILNGVEWSKTLEENSVFRTRFKQAVSNVFVNVIGMITTTIISLLPADSVDVEFEMEHEALVSNDVDMPNRESMENTLYDGIKMGYFSPYEISEDGFYLNEIVEEPATTVPETSPPILGHQL
ncbi:uncharacterized protein LOC144354109 [Saccoglossus kowalevskii]